MKLNSPRTIALALSMMRMCKMLLGLVVLYLSVLYFGASVQRDAWVASVGAYGALVIMLYSPLNDTFRTKFIYMRKQDGEAAALRAVNALLWILALTFVVVLLVAVSFSGHLASSLAPGFDASGLKLLGSMLVALSPFLAFEQCGNILKAILNTYESYFYPDLMTLLASVVNIVFIVTMAPGMGIFCLVAACLVNTSALVLVLWWQVRRHVPSFHLLPASPLRLSLPFLAFSLPVYLASFSAQAYIILERAVSSRFFEGAVSFIDYGRQIMNLPLLVFSSVVPTVMTPILARKCADGRGLQFEREFRNFVRMLMSFSIVIALVMLLCTSGISFVFFGRVEKSFASTLVWFGCATFPLILSMLCTQALIAQNRVGHMVVCEVVGNALAMVLCAFAPSADVGDLALYFAIGQTIKAVLMCASIRLSHKAGFWQDVFSLAAMFLGLYFALSFLLVGHVNFEASQSKAFVLAQLAAIGITIFIFCASSHLLLFSQDRNMVLSLFRRRLGRSRRRARG